MGRLSATFCSGKYSVLNDFCYAEFLAYYTLESESDKTYEYQPNKLDDSQIENNHEDCLYLTEKKNDFKRNNPIPQSKTNTSISCAK